MVGVAWLHLFPLNTVSLLGPHRGYIGGASSFLPFGHAVLTTSEGETTVWRLYCWPFTTMASPSIQRQFVSSRQSFRFFDPTR